MQSVQFTNYPIKTTMRQGIWSFEFDKIPGYTFLEDDKGLGIELAYTSNGWFRYRNYENEQLCVYSSSQIVTQTLHVTESIRRNRECSMNHNVQYKWGEWIIICSIGTIYVINNTDQHQALLLSPFESGFVFYPTDKNPLNMERIISYPENRSN